MARVCASSADLAFSADLGSPTADTAEFTADRASVTVTVSGLTTDGLLPTADSLGDTVDADTLCTLPPGWPCADLPDIPPSVADKQSAPTAEELLPQVIALAPRGAAWGADEAGDGHGASRVMRMVWKALAHWTADLNRRDFDLATQVFPSAITTALPDWERELGLPDPCFRGGSGTDARIAAVRARFGAQGGQSPAYFVCLAASVGYAITIEEPDQFMVDVSEVVEDSIEETWFRIDEGEIDGDPLEGFVMKADVEDADELSDETAWRHWVVHVASLGETWFRIDEGEIDYDPLEGFHTAADLECLLRRHCPQHTTLTFHYAV